MTKPKWQKRRLGEPEFWRNAVIVVVLRTAATLAAAAIINKIDSRDR